MRLAITPDTPRTPAVLACIQEEQRREAIFEGVVKLRCGEHDYFKIAFEEKGFNDLAKSDREHMLSLGVTEDEYYRWHGAYANWKGQQQKPVPLSDFIDGLLAQRPTAA